MSLEQFYDTATRGRPDEIEAAIRAFSASTRLRDPLAIAMRGLKGIVSGDVPGGVALLRRAIEHAEPLTAQYLTEILVPYLITAFDIDSAEEALERAGAPLAEELVPAFLALRAIIEARRGHDERSREYAAEALALGRALDHRMIAARVLQRSSLAAFYREDFSEAQDRSLEAARTYERLDSHRNAATSYTVLYVIASDWLNDPDVARFYAERVTMSANLAGDLTLQNYGLVAQLVIAAETADLRRLGSIRARLLANRVHEQYQERPQFIISEALHHAWSGNLDQARLLLSGLEKRPNQSLAETAFVEALLAVLDAARWDIASARRRAHRVIGKTVAHPEHEPIFEARRRRIARTLAACACLLVGDTTRGRRALSRPFDPDAYFTSLSPTRDLDEAGAPALMRGYVRLVNVARATAFRARPKHGLTDAEMRVLRALPDDATIAQIAEGFGKSKKTIERQVGSIYDKLRVSSRAQAIQRARDLGIYA